MTTLEIKITLGALLVALAILGLEALHAHRAMAEIKGLLLAADKSRALSFRELQDKLARVLGPAPTPAPPVFLSVPSPAAQADTLSLPSVTGGPDSEGARGRTQVGLGPVRAAAYQGATAPRGGSL
jgi:hypothetical protein